MVDIYVKNGEIDLRSKIDAIDKSVKTDRYDKKGRQLDIYRKEVAQSETVHSKVLFEVNLLKNLVVN